MKIVGRINGCIEALSQVKTNHAKYHADINGKTFEIGKITRKVTTAFKASTLQLFYAKTRRIHRQKYI